MEPHEEHLCCKSCNTNLLDIVIVTTKGPRNTFKAENCPLCGGESFSKEIIGITAIDSKFEIKVYDSDTDGELIKNTVRF